MLKLDIAHLLIQSGLLVWQASLGSGILFILAHLFLVGVAIMGLAATLSRPRGQSSSRR
ncbi:hypothetical protein [Rhizobium leguminosarum]